MKKVWKPVVGYEDLYLVSNDGEVKSAKTGKVLQQQHVNGYRFVNICKDGKTKNTAVHRLVCAAFNGAPKSDDMQVDHLNMIRSDNRASNLEWVTGKENKARAARMRRAVRGVADDGSVIVFPSLWAADDHGFDSTIINRSIPRGLPYCGFIWEVLP